jgi:hypothetical protein
MGVPPRWINHLRGRPGLHRSVWSHRGRDAVFSRLSRLIAWPQPDFHWSLMHGGVGLQEQLRQRAKFAHLPVQSKYSLDSRRNSRYDVVVVVREFC